VTELVVIFRTHSDIEASIVRALLESHGITSLVSSDIPHSVFPLSIDGLGEVRLAVHRDHVEEAQRVIDAHRVDVPGGQLIRLKDEFEELQEVIGYRFRDRGLLEHALTHTSRANEDASGGVIDNESLEFLGDAVLGFVIADELFRRFPDCDEGQKSKMKAALVSTAALANVGERLHLGDHLLLGRGEEKTGGRRKQALIADCFEALIAAVHLDGGIERAREFIERHFADAMDEMRRTEAYSGDHKSALQEHLQSRDLPLPDYRVVGEIGPDHRKQFQIAVTVNGESLAEATGRSKKEAEQEAARLALLRLKAPR
jgi:ribonuclease-3